MFSLSPLTILEHSEKVAIYKPERELLSETDHASTQLDVPPPNCEKIDFCCLNLLFYGILLEYYLDNVLKMHRMIIHSVSIKKAYIIQF